MKIIAGIWFTILFAGIIFTVGTIASNFLLSLVGLVPLALTAMLCVLVNRD